MIRDGPSGRPPGRPLIRSSRLFGGFGHHVDAHIFAAELAVVECDPSAHEREKGMILADAHITARVNSRSALTNHNVAGVHFLSAITPHTETAAGSIAALALPPATVRNSHRRLLLVPNGSRAGGCAVWGARYGLALPR